MTKVKVAGALRVPLPETAVILRLAMAHGMCLLLLSHVSAEITSTGGRSDVRPIYWRAAHSASCSRLIFTLWRVSTGKPG